MNRTDLLNWFVFSHGYRDYLEIGVQNRTNFNRVNAKNKIGVDPVGNCNFPFTSDEFFEMINRNYKFDLIFIDGMHTEEQVTKDIRNSLKHLRKDGTIVIHDCNPLTKEAQQVPRIQVHWNGTVWKAFVKLRLSAVKLTIRCINIDEGCGVIQRGKPDKIFDWAPCVYDWEIFNERREELLGLISWDKFCGLYDPSWFLKIEDDVIIKLYRTKEIGFHKDSDFRIPQEYLDAGMFTVFRYAFGLGDWAIISAMPRLLKEKYPDCKVMLPSKKFLHKTFIPIGELKKWGCWGDPRDVIEHIFKNNPYVDGYTDNIPGIIYHDHYRIIPDDEDTPMIEQMLTFWGFTPEEFKDGCPELYFNDEEKEAGDAIIEEYTKGKDFMCFLYSEKATDEDMKKINEAMDHTPDLPMFFYVSGKIKELGVNIDPEVYYDMKDIPIRIQLYIKTKAIYNIGNQCGVNDAVARYSPTHVVPRNLKHNFVRCEHYL